jgi:hypothetical protein
MARPCLSAPVLKAGLVFLSRRAFPGLLSEACEAPLRGSIRRDRTLNYLTRCLVTNPFRKHAMKAECA